MLKLILGRAGCGKTSYMFSKIADEVKNKKRSLLIVPEQYSHDAERAICEICGDEASLYTEAVGFSRLCNRVFAETGGLAARTMDKGGSVLAMSVALSSLSANLKVYNVGERGSDFLCSLLNAYDELSSSKNTAENLIAAGETAGGAFGDKLKDLALIFAMYESVVKQSGCECEDRIGKLAEAVGQSSVCNARIFIDGFTDFTARETDVINELIRSGADITVCLNTPSQNASESIFELPAKTARRLIAAAKDNNIECEIIRPSAKKDSTEPAIRFVEENLFAYNDAKFDGDTSSVEIVSGENVYEECSYAAASVLRLVRSGLRFRDIAIASPDWNKYASAAEDVLRKYGIPADVTQRRNILEKPVMLFLMSALDVISDNWSYNSVFRYIKTGFAGISHQECDMLENYALKWNLRGLNIWSRDEKWTMHPRGYADNMTEQDVHDLDTVDALRRTVAEPLAKLQKNLTENNSAIEKVRALYRFLTDVSFANKLKTKIDALNSSGNLKLADEYEQMWNVLIRGMQQFADVLGDAPVSTERFTRLMKLVLSQYDIGTIPTSIDSVCIGDLARVRGRGVKCLIIMGATNTAMPSLQDRGGIFSDDERERLNALGIEITGYGDDRIARELGSIYSSLSLPDKKLIITYPTGGGSRKSYLISRISDILGIKETSVSEEVYTEALAPCFEYAVSEDTENAKHALAYFETLPEWKDRAEAVKRAAKMPKGKLTKLTAEKLYGKNITVSASRVDKYHSCRYSYFLQYGLKAKPREAAELDAMQTGTFMHYVLENVVKEVENLGGFAQVKEDVLKSITRKYTRLYAQTSLGGLEDKTGRFKYLFNRLCDDIWRVVQATADELSNSDFKPLDFELEFSSTGDLPPAEVATEDGFVRVKGFVDRVDGWIKDDKIYIRIVDYKTGKKEFSLSDVWYGRGLQMLIYLFVLQKYGRTKYGRTVVPAGVLYTPARDVLISSPTDLDDTVLQKKRISSIKRSGILLNDPAVIEAMEHGNSVGYLPVKFSKDGTVTGDNLVSLEELGKLSRHIDTLLKDMAEEINGGSIKADPYFKGQMDNACVYCDYFEICHIDDGQEDTKRYISKLANKEVWDKMRAENE